MNFLSIDCSNDIGSLFLKIENRSFSKFLQSDKYNNDLLMKQIQDFLKENDVTFKNINEILVNQGPGNFSGLRGSISTSKGICLARNMNLYGYNNFLLASIKFYDSDKPVYSFIKFKNNYFVQKFNQKLTCSINPEVVTLEEILSKYNKNIKIVDTRYVKFFDKEILNLSNLHITSIDYKELEFLKKKNLLQKSIKGPIYLHRSTF